MIEVQISSVAFGDEAVIPTRATFPPGTWVTDAVAGRKYRLGLSEQLLDETIEEATEIILEAQRNTDAVEENPVQQT